MPKFDLEREPSPETVAKAIEDYGDRLDDPRHDLIALLVAQGQPISKAYKRAYPASNQRTAETQASILCAHPEMRRRIADQELGPRQLAQAALVESVQHTIDLMRSSDSAAIRLKAAASLQDRAGLPRLQQLAVQAHHTVHAILQRHTTELPEMVDVTPLRPSEPKALPEPAKGQQQAQGTPPHPLPRQTPSEVERGSWGELYPSQVAQDAPEDALDLE